MPVGSTTDERRLDPRIEAGVPAVVTPLANVAIHYKGRVVDVSRGGVKVHVDETFLDRLPRKGDAYRVQTGEEVLLCEVRHCQIEDDGAKLGLKVLHWGNPGSLRLLLGSLRLPSGAGADQ